MTIQEELKEVMQLHDEYNAVKYTENNPIGLIYQFNEWHGKSATLFTRYLSPTDVELQKFKNIEHGNCYELASQFDEIETPFRILIDRLERSVYSKLEQLVFEGEEIVKTIKYIKAPSNVLRTFDVYSLGNESEYQTWKNKCIRLLRLNFMNDGSCDSFVEAEKLFSRYHYNPKYMHDMIGVLKSCVEMPCVVGDISLRNKPDTQGQVTINLNQIQTQSQNIVVDIFLEAIKDEIQGKQYKELKEIATAEQDPIKAKTKILDKVKSFGNNVLSNIVANIITNPNIWSEFI